MKASNGKILNIEFVDGETWEQVKCTNNYVKDNEEENILEFRNTIEFQSEIEKIEILNL